MANHETVRDEVSEAYSRAIKAKSCCSGGATKSQISEAARYTEGDVAGLPAGVVSSSFGCGNPLAFSEVKEGQIVLDLGSGAGLDLLVAAKKVGPGGHVIGVDMTDAMIDRARANVSAAGLQNVEVRKGIIESLPVDSASVDWVISNCVINLSPEKDRVFREIARVLKPGGKMLVSDIVAEDLPEWVRSHAQAYAACVGGAISESEYVRGLTDAGLASVEVRERHVYDASQIASLVADELATSASAGNCCASVVPRHVLEAVARQVEGKVWSAKFSAEKPRDRQ